LIKSVKRKIKIRRSSITPKPRLSVFDLVLGIRRGRKNSIGRGTSAMEGRNRSTKEE
jgi:hypothetical protein